MSRIDKRPGILSNKRVAINDGDQPRSTGIQLRQLSEKPGCCLAVVPPSTAWQAVNRGNRDRWHRARAPAEHSTQADNHRGSLRIVKRRVVPAFFPAVHNLKLLTNMRRANRNQRRGEADKQKGCENKRRRGWLMTGTITRSALLWRHVGPTAQRVREPGSTGRCGYPALPCPAPPTSTPEFIRHRLARFSNSTGRLL